MIEEFYLILFKKKERLKAIFGVIYAFKKATTL